MDEPNGYKFTVVCGGDYRVCWCRTEWFVDPEDAAKAWNYGDVLCLQCGGSGRSEVNTRCYICEGTGRKRLRRAPEALPLLAGEGR